MRRQMLMNTLKWMIGGFFFAFRYIIIPVTRHSIKHGWIFPVLGLVIGIVIHSLLYHNINALNHYATIPIYILLFAGGIVLMVRKLRRNKYIVDVYTNPTVPSQLHGKED